MKFWKIVTNFIHDPIAVRDSSGETMILLEDVKWTKQMHIVVNGLVDSHNKEVRNLNILRNKKARKINEISNFDDVMDVCDANKLTYNKLKKELGF